MALTSLNLYGEPVPSSGGDGGEETGWIVGSSTGLLADLSSCTCVRTEFENAANRTVYLAALLDRYPQELRQHHFCHSADLTLRRDSPPEGAIQAANTQFALLFFHFSESPDFFQYRKGLKNTLPQSCCAHLVAKACGQTLPDGAENLIQVRRGESLGENL